MTFFLVFWRLFPNSAELTFISTSLIKSTLIPFCLFKKFIFFRLTCKVMSFIMAFSYKYAIFLKGLFIYLYFICPSVCLIHTHVLQAFLVPEDSDPWNWSCRSAESHHLSARNLTRIPGKSRKCHLFGTTNVLIYFVLIHVPVHCSTQTNPVFKPHLFILEAGHAHRTSPAIRCSDGNRSESGLLPNAS